MDLRFNAQVDLRVRALSKPGVVCRGRIEETVGTCVRLACDGEPIIDEPIEVEGPEFVLLGEVLSVERTATGSVARLRVVHALHFAEWAPRHVQATASS
jgi:hypothetical protein